MFEVELLDCAFKVVVCVNNTSMKNYTAILYWINNVQKFIFKTRARAGWDTETETRKCDIAFKGAFLMTSHK